MRSPRGEHIGGRIGSVGRWATGRFKLSLALFLMLGTLISAPAGAEIDSIVTRLSSTSFPDGIAGDGASSDVSVSGDGAWVVFSSAATDLVADDTNGARDIFLFDVANEIITRISVRSDGAQAGSGSFNPVISADGTTVAYESTANNLVSGPNNGKSDIYTYDRATGTTVRISNDTTGNASDGDSNNPAISDDGTKIAFSSQATDLVSGDDNGFRDVFVHDTGAGTTTRVSVATGGAQAVVNDPPIPFGEDSHGPALSGDGSVVVFYSYSDDLVSGDDNEAADVFRHQAGVTTRISVASNGTQANGTSGRPSVSEDGNLIVYTSAATNLIADDRNGAVADVFLHNVASSVTRVISVSNEGAQANGASGEPSGFGNLSTGGPEISDDGSTVVFSSDGNNLIVDDTNMATDIFSYNLLNSTISRVSVAADSSESDGDSLAPTLSGNGSIVAFASDSANLITSAGTDDTNGTSDVFLTQVNNVGPVLSDVTVGIPEGSPVGTVVTTVPGTDADGDPITYSITAGNTGSKFTIKPTSGVITTIGTLNFESRAQYVLTVSGTDGSLTDTATVTVNVTDSNEAPAVTGFTISVAENVPLRTTLGTVTASDPDGDPLTYSITAGNGSGLFSIQPTSGKVFTVGTLDFETKKTHTLTVSASDGLISGQAVVTVNVTDVVESGPGDPGDPGDPIVPDPDYNPFDDDDGSIFENDIEWLALSGITSGCGTRLFCPGATVTRGQMAAFLNRALNLPAATRDYFDDDNTSIFEDDINRLAQSGITKGCGQTTFCPGAAVTRGQMAAFLVRAFEYTDDGGGDLFTDDDTSIFEADIDKLATAGVTLGCNPPANTNYCPATNVSRAQMAAFLHRAFE